MAIEVMLSLELQCNELHGPPIVGFKPHLCYVL